MLDVPNFFWESEPTLYPLYIAVREYLEIKPRIQVLNERCRVFLDLAEILSDSIADNKESRKYTARQPTIPHLQDYPIAKVRDMSFTNSAQTKPGSSSSSSSSPYSSPSPRLSFALASSTPDPAPPPHPPPFSPPSSALEPRTYSARVLLA